MKELSIEQKAKAYDEAIKKAGERYNEEYTSTLERSTLAYVFPVLKGERIRKLLLENFKSLSNACTKNNCYRDDITYKDVVAWLEKQGKNSVRWNENIDGNKPQKNHSVLMKTTHGITEGEWNGDDSWIQYRWSSSIKNSDVLFWIELSDLENHDSQILANSAKTCKDEQKPVDKVKPKFKVGDFLVSDYCMGKVVELTNDAYLLDTEQSIPFSCEHNAHLWTIQDAKDGDVLSYREGQWIFIYKQGEGTSFEYYALVSENGLTINDVAFTALVSCIVPATKEQRETLEKAMANAGYTFDFEKKELKKIEQKFNIGDEIKTANEEPLTITKIDEKGYWSEDLFICGFDDAAKWELVGKNLTWSEEDEINLEKAIWYVENPAPIVVKDSMLVEWLKSLKDRYTWKPSDEQIKALNYVVNLMASSERPTENDLYYNILKSLRQQLKKLREK